MKYLLDTKRQQPYVHPAVCIKPMGVVMITSEITLEDKIRILPPDLQREVEDFVDFLLAKQRRAELAALEQQAVAHGWPPGFFTKTAGSIDDPTFVRQPQG